MLGEKSYNFSLTNWPQSNLVLNSQHLVSQLGHLKTIIAVFRLDGKVCSLKSELLRSRTSICLFFKVSDIYLLVFQSVFTSNNIFFCPGIDL